MLSEDSSVSTKTNNFEKNSGIKIVLVVAFIVIISLSSIIYWWFPKTESPWISENAYTTYEGKTTLLGLISLNVTVRLEVVDSNLTHANVLSYVKLETNSTDPAEYQKIIWINFENKSLTMEDSELIDVYEETIYIEGFGNRDCFVYEYITENRDLIFYLDKQTVWSIKLNYGLEGEFDLSLDLNLVETNIPELKKMISFF